MNTKIRTIIVTVIAAGSFASATVAPPVSRAEDNNTSQGVAARECQGYREMAQHDIEESVEAVGREDYDAAAFWSNAASEDVREAEKACAAAAAAARSLTKAVVARGGAISTSPVPAKPVAVVKARAVTSFG
jgi:hypothetical protein